MSKLKVWERRVVGIYAIDDQEEKELADCFNRSFTTVLKSLPKADRRVLFDMLYLVNKLYKNESIKKFKLGISCGYEAGLRYSVKKVL